MRCIARRGWWMVCAATLLVTAALACGDTLPVSDASDRGDAAMDGDTGTTGETEGGTDDGGVDASDAAFDAAEAGPPCTPDLPYGDPVALDNFAGLGAVSSLRPHHGGAPFAFVARDLGSGTFFDVVETDFPLPPSTNPAALRSTTNDEDHPAPLAGNMKVYYDEPIDAGELRIFSATRTQAGQKLDNPQLEDIPLSGGTSVMHPWSVDGQDILYVAVRNGASTVNIWRIVKSGATWAPDPQLVGPFEKTHPVVSNDETVMYFARNETGKRKIFYVTRASAAGSWSTALEMQGAVNQSAYDDEPSWISPDKCTLIFISNRGGSPRPYQIVRQHL